MDNLNNLDLNLLKALNALLQERNVTRAAERLALTQPAVSAMLNRLRHRFNDPLFVRAGHGMMPTDRALALAAPVQRILGDIAVLVQPAEFNPAELDLTFKIAATTNGVRNTGIPFALQLRTLAPKVKTAFVSIHGQDIPAMLEKGEWDVAITGEHNLPERLHYRRCNRQRYVCAVRENHPVLQQPWNLGTFCALDFVLVSYHGGQFAGATDEALAKLGRRRNVVLSVTDFLLIPEILQQSDWATVLPEAMLQQSDRLQVLEPPLPIEGYHKAIAWHERSHHNPAQQWLRQLLWQVSQR
ncbi:LysR family transcriptional regulator [Pasteurella testudinis]|uniref:LysR family transcriptional regulator n=1 Tax=Pasteurella testudinis TaxID=761 RepID=UPI00405A33B2